MNVAQRYARKQALLRELDGLAAEARDAYLDKACAGDATMRAEVLALFGLTQTMTATVPMENPPQERYKDADFTFLGLGEPETIPLIGKVIDRYRIVRLIGEGGMGAVFLAERIGDFDMRVALKLIRGATPDLVLRFTRERQILATLQHPGIARLYDGGSTDDGTPYIAMEYIDGEPITTYAARNSLSVAERLELFAKVCDAVSFAHQNLIIHRDIKPSNVLVTADGEAKLLDFGIAAIQDREKGEALTVYAGMTPSYASPEQLALARLTAATDQYSLGVLLYELLTGTRPFDRARSLSEHAARPLVTRPSVAVGQATEQTRAEAMTQTWQKPPGNRTTSPANKRLKQILQGDIDAIVLKALRYEPGERYPTVSEFAADIRRFLASEPVLARAPSGAYVMRKFLERHRFESAAAGVLVVCLMIAALFIVQAWQAERIAHAEADRAVKETNDRDRIMLSSITSPDPSFSGKDVRLVDLLDRAEFEAQKSFQGSPLELARLLTLLGRSYSGLGLSDRANSRLTAANDLFVQELGANAPETLSSENDLIENSRASATPEQYRADTEKFYQRVQQLLPANNLLVLRAFSNMANAYLFLVSNGHPEFAERARATLASNLQRQTSAYGPDHEHTTQARNSYANIFAQTGHPAEAEALYRENMLDQITLLGPNNYYTLETINNLAATLNRLNRNEEARALLQPTLININKVNGPESAMSLGAELNYARILISLGRNAEARERLLSIEKIAAPHPELAQIHKTVLELKKNLPKPVPARRR